MQHQYPQSQKRISRRTALAGLASAVLLPFLGTEPAPAQKPSELPQKGNDKIVFPENPFYAFQSSLNYRFDRTNKNKFDAFLNLWKRIDPKTQKLLGKLYSNPEEVELPANQEPEYERFNHERIPTGLLRHYQNHTPWTVLPTGTVVIDGKRISKTTESDRKFLFLARNLGFLASELHPLKDFRDALGKERLDGNSDTQNKNLEEIWRDAPDNIKNLFYMAYAFPDEFQQIHTQSTRDLYKGFNPSDLVENDVAKIEFHTPWKFVRGTNNRLSLPDTNYLFLTITGKDSL